MALSVVPMKRTVAPLVDAPQFLRTILNAVVPVVDPTPLKSFAKTLAIVTLLLVAAVSISHGTSVMLPVKLMVPVVAVCE